MVTLNRSTPVVLLLGLACLLSLSSCSNTTYLPLGYGGSPDIRKLNSEMRGQEIYINDQVKAEPPVTVRWAIDTFFTARPGQPATARSYKELNSITFRHHMEAGKRGAIIGAGAGVIIGIVAMVTHVSDAIEDEDTPNFLALYGPYVGGIGGAGIGFLVGYLMGMDYHYVINR
jgi:hypothetical protein